MNSFLFLTALAVLLGMSQSAIVEDKVREELASQGTTTVILHFKGPKSKEILSDYQRIHRPQEKSVHPDVLPSMLEENANKQQAKTLNLLKERQLSKTPGSDFFQLWAYNKIVVYNADPSLVDELVKNDEIESITADEVFDHPFDSESTGPIIDDLGDETEPQWGVQDVQAPEAWERGFSGSGVTVGVIDTGIRATHDLLKSQFRKTFGWFDALDRKTTPYDDHSHGTHVAGIIAGSKGFGVAPKATIIACKSLPRKGVLGRSSASLACGQFMLCPTDPTGKTKNCSARPKIINNSWASGRGNTFFDEIIDLWLAQNQIVVFGSNNEGDKCGTTGSPADNKKVVSVASIDESNQVAKTSGRGPAKSGIIKPDIAAPGVEILSAVHTSNTATAIKSGTSMASPHVAGAAAIFCSQNPDLTQSEFMAKLKAGAKPTEPTGKSCGGVSDSKYPNNHVGYGKLQILAGLE